MPTQIELKIYIYIYIYIYPELVSYPEVTDSKERPGGCNLPNLTQINATMLMCMLVCLGIAKAFKT